MSKVYEEFYIMEGRLLDRVQDELKYNPDYQEAKSKIASCLERLGDSAVLDELENWHVIKSSYESARMFEKGMDLAFKILGRVNALSIDYDGYDDK